MTGSAVQQRIAELRANLKQTGSLSIETPDASGQPAENNPGAPDAPAGSEAPAPESGTNVPTQGADGRWRYADGTFAPPPAADIATDGSESDAETDGEPEGDAAPEPIVVKVRGREANEEVEIEVTDPKVAELLRANANDGMRRAEYNKQVAALESERAELREIAVMLDTSPESIVEQMSPERRERIFRYIYAADFDRLAQTVEQWYNDPLARRTAQVDMRDEIRTSRAEAERAAAGERKAAEIRLAVRELIPQHASDDDARDFYADSLHALTRVATERGDLNPADVPTLLQSRVARYWGSASAAPAPTPAKPPIAVAKPVGPNAEQMAQRAKAAVARTQNAQATRKIAAKVAPQGAGAVPTQKPMPPKGLGIKGVVEWAKKNNFFGT